MVDQHRGVKAGPEPLRTPPSTTARLMAARRFVKFYVLHLGKLAVGDE
jgi:hypothetical protein